MHTKNESNVFCEEFVELNMRFYYGYTRIFAIL